MPSSLEPEPVDESEFSLKRRATDGFNLNVIYSNP